MSPGLRSAALQWNPGRLAFAADVGDAMRISAAVCALGGLVAFGSVRRAAPAQAFPQPSMTLYCNELALGAMMSS